jgi:hypothetical protein
MGHYLASMSTFLSSSELSWIVGVVVAIAVVLVIQWTVKQMRKIRGPVLEGTAEVLSLRQFGIVGGNAVGREICRLRLRVSVLGQEPYDVIVWRNIEPWNVGLFQKGCTIAVEVSQTNPKKIQLGRSGKGPTGADVRIVNPQQNITFNQPPKVTFSQSSWSPETGWTGSPPPGDVADQIKAAVEGAFQPSVGQQAEAYRQSAGVGPVLSAAALLASGQRVAAALKSFAPTGTTPRSLGRTPSRPELIDAPHYMLEVELHFPNLAPITGRAVQTVPVAHVPSLAVGLPLTCAVDPADPSHRFVVDWDAARSF